MQKVLIIDDSSYMRMFLKKIIEKGGAYSVVEASTREEATEQFTTIKPDIVTLDLNMSDSRTGGIDVLTDILKIDPKAVVIIISAAGYENLEAECKELGAKTYIKKPFSTEVLLKTLEENKSKS